MAEKEDRGVDRRQALECMVWAGTGVLWTLAGGVPKSALLGSAQAAEAGVQLPADLRQPRRLRQGGQSRRARHAARGDRQGRRDAGRARLHDPYRRHHAFVEAQAIRRRRPGHRRGAARCPLRAGRARRDRRDAGQGLSRPLRQERQRRGLVFLRPGRRSFHRPRQCRRPQGRRHGQSRGRRNSPGSPTIWRAKAPRRRSSCSRISRCGPLRRNGAGAPRIPRRRSALLARFGSVTVLNGHIHQLMQKVEGAVTFYTARSTAFPQPAPGTPGRNPAGYCAREASFSISAAITSAARALSI